MIVVSHVIRILCEVYHTHGPLSAALPGADQRWKSMCFNNDTFNSDQKNQSISYCSLLEIWVDSAGK